MTKLETKTAWPLFFVFVDQSIYRGISIEIAWKCVKGKIGNRRYQYLSEFNEFGQQQQQSVTTTENLVRKRNMSQIKLKKTIFNNNNNNNNRLIRSTSNVHEQRCKWHHKVIFDWTILFPNESKWNEYCTMYGLDLVLCMWVWIASHLWILNKHTRHQVNCCIIYLVFASEKKKKQYSILGISIA